MHPHQALCAFAICSLLTSHAEAEAPRYRVQVLPSSDGELLSINNAGLAVGSAWDSASGRRAISWDGSQMTALPPSMEYARTISEAGHIGGRSPLFEEGGYVHTLILGRVYHQNSMDTVTDAFSPDYSQTSWYTYTTVRDINSSGTVLASQETNGGGGSFLAAGNSTTVLPIGGLALNDAGQVAGLIGGADGTTRAAIYHQGQVTTIGLLEDIQGAYSLGSDINEAGMVIGTFGYYTQSAHVTRSFMWQDGVLAALGDAGVSSLANAVNNTGDVVGLFDPYGTDKRAYLYHDGVQYELASLIEEQGWSIKAANDINDAGQIVGTACKAGACYAALLSPVPEPATYALLLAGLAVVARARQGRTGPLC